MSARVRRVARAGLRSGGFTLVELMIVVLVIGILAAIAVPGYRQYTLRVTRADAKVALTARAQRLEQCFTRFNVYNRTDPAFCTAVIDLPANTPDNTYRITVNFPAPNQFELTATPINGQADDTKCNAFTLDHTGTQDVVGATLSRDECW